MPSRCSTSTSSRPSTTATATRPATNVLRLVAKALLATVRSGDTVGRVGGDEFIAMLHDVDVDGARAAAENIRNAVHDS